MKGRPIVHVSRIARGNASRYLHHVIMRRVSISIDVTGHESSHMRCRLDAFCIGYCSIWTANETEASDDNSRLMVGAFRMNVFIFSAKDDCNVLSLLYTEFEKCYTLFGIFRQCDLFQLLVFSAGPSTRTSRTYTTDLTKLC